MAGKRRQRPRETGGYRAGGGTTWFPAAGTEPGGRVGSGRETGGGRSDSLDRSLAVCVFLMTLCVYLLTAGGHIVSEDGTQIFNTTRSLVREGSFALPYGHAMEGRDGKLYCRYGIGQSLAAVPFYSVGLALSRIGPDVARKNPEFVERFATSMLNPFLGALVVVILFLLGRRVGFSRRTSLALALSYGLCTFAWAGAKYFVSGTLQALCMAAALLALLREGGLRKREAAVSGLLLGVAFLAKPASAVLFPAYAACAWLGPGDRPLGKTAIGRLVAFTLPFAAAGMVTAAYNYYRFASPFEFGFGFQDPRQRAFSTPLGVGLYGLLLSSGKSIFLYAPAAVLFFGSIRSLIRRNAVAGVLCVLVPAAHVLFYAKWVAWHGDGFWGPRYLLPALPFLLLPVGALLETRPERARKWKYAFIGAAALGLIVQIGGVSVNYATYFREVGAYPYTRSFYDPRFMEDVHFNPAFTPVVGHWRILARIAAGKEGWDRISLSGPPVESRVPVGEEEAEAFRRGLDLWFIHFYRAGLPAGLYVWAPFILVAGAVLSGWRLWVLAKRGEVAGGVP
jgi:hypothetical protein